MTRPRWVARATFALALVGATVSAYLTVVHFTSSTLLACGGSGTIDCERVLSSRWSAVHGVPVALLGLGWFVAMAVLCSPRAWRSPSRAVARSRIGLAVAGIGSVLWLVYAELFLIGSICLWCTVVHVIAFALFALVMLYGRSEAEAEAPTGERPRVRSTSPTA